MIYQQVIEFFTALLAPVIALVATYIAWQQWQLNRQRLHLELYDRRLHVYNVVSMYLAAAAHKEKLELEDAFTFISGVSEADFLFGPEIPEYIAKINRHAATLRKYRSEYRDNTQPPREGYDHQEVVEWMHREEDWFLAQPEIAREKFRKYLSLN